MKTNCTVCHSVSATEESRIAPPMIAVKRRYLKGNVSKEEFIILMQNWMENPTKENAKMFGAVEKFGLMPKLGYSKNTIEKISEYMFDEEIEKPEWFEDHYKKERQSGIKQNKQQGNNLSYAEKGLNYAMSTKATLGKNLMNKIQTESTLAALSFCNVKAHPLTDSMAVVNKASIKRVSDKPRNLKNKANTEELKYINLYKEDVKEEKESEPIVVERASVVNVYYPIKTNGMCLQCHGSNNQIKQSIVKELEKLYPNDLAVGYDINEVRGIWNISFNK